jgi:pimeloyl-ACP methyl ester carboxylesterase
MTEMPERPRGMKLIDVRPFVLDTRRAIMVEQLAVPVVRGRVDTNGLDTYYEIHGAGEPLLYLHGGFNSIEMLAQSLPALAERHRVYVPERQGHGRTPDRDGPLTFETMASDTITFLDAMDLSAAGMVGFSDGAMVAMHVALARPDLVGRLVVMGSAANQDGIPPAHVEMMKQMTADTFPPMFREMYGAISPDGPDHFPVLFDKAKPNFFAPGFTLDRLGDVQSPTLVLIADDDAVTVEHAAAMARALPDGSQLAVVPGTSHGLPFEKPELVNRLVLDFLDPHQVEKMMQLD